MENFFIICYNAYAKELVLLDENLLKDHINDNIPTIEKINISYDNDDIYIKLLSLLLSAITLPSSDGFTPKFAASIALEIALT